MKKWLSKFRKGDEGAMLVEYALLLTGIAAACAAAVSALGSVVAAL
jgi:Flp pilus assembly pilin Flp